MATKRAPRGKTRISRPIDAHVPCDLLVLGGGMAGVCAALAAARNGLDVALCEMESCLGGNGGPLLGVHVSGAHSFHPYAGETGLIEELELEAAYLAAKTRTSGHHYNISHQWELVLAEKLATAGVRVFRRHIGRQAETDGRRITGVVVDDLDTFTTKLFDTRLGLVEASGDGAVAASAGAAFMRGVEARATFGERSAPAEATDQAMGSSLTALVVRRREAVEFLLPPAYRRRRDEAGPVVPLTGPGMWNADAESCFLWVTESGGNRDVIADEASIREELLYQLFCWWDNIKSYSYPAESRNWELVWVSPKTGRRESRRFVGDTVVTQTDVESGRVFDDAVAYGGYGVDIHEPVGNGARVVFHSIPPLWTFPYSAAYSVSFDNLWLAGRLVSCSHLALGTVRLQRTLAGIGQAVGTAAALAAEHDCSARAVGADHLAELRARLLRQDASWPGAVNDDPADLARGARVTATSEMRHGATRVADFMPLDLPRGVELWHWPERLEQVEFYVRNTAERQQGLTLSIAAYEPPRPWKEEAENLRHRHIRGAPLRMEWGADHRQDRFDTVARANAEVPPSYQGWVRFRLPRPLRMLPVDATSDEPRYVLLLGGCPGMELAVDNHEYDFALRLWQPIDGSEYRVAANCHAFRLAPAPRCGEADNVIDGHNRRFATNPVHAWISDPELDLPQSLTLTFPEPTTFSTVQLTFDTLDRSYADTPINSDERVPRRCAAYYRLEARGTEGWTLLADISGNYQRHRVHTFDPVTATGLRLSIMGVWDPRHRARVYEVRVYA
ncbi:MAG: FAD-dependent oxidoreductase [Armatimonadetes bacterium]|nr:FAD-dependent oxidoreductase [Armatimonadota bacterium]